MPGFIAMVDVPGELSRRIVAAFQEVWPSAQVVRLGGALVGAHSFTSDTALLTGDDGAVTAVDGEFALYRGVIAAREDRRIRLLRPLNDATVLGTASVGSVVRVSAEGDELVVATDATGTFPVYYAEAAGGLVVGTLLRPLARAIGARPDRIATLGFLREGHIVGPSSFFEGIRRLLPGQVLTVRRGRRPQIAETSDAWVPRQQSGLRVTAEILWEGLTSAVRRALPATGTTLMMSGGWDSRTLLAAAGAEQIRPTCYSHGDTRSRELAIVRAICRHEGLEARLEEIDDRVLDPQLLELGFARTENVVFPHWQRAGRLIADANSTVVTAGVLGEVLGGHYGPAMMQGGIGKILSVGSTLLGPLAPRTESRGPTARDLLLRRREFGTHWYLDRDLELSLLPAAGAIDGEIEAQLARFERRGVQDQAALVEAFLTEHRGAQYVSAQLRSCRAYADVAVPFGGGELFSISTAMPIQLKVHNRLNQRLLAQHSPVQLRYPFAATLLPASYPILLQEASRLVRKGASVVRDRFAAMSGGRMEPSRTGWVHFDFLRGSRALETLADSLTLEIWDRDAIRQGTRRLAEPGSQLPTHPFYDQFAKILTVEHMFRGS
jgi:hypothetical protein